MSVCVCKTSYTYVCIAGQGLSVVREGRGEGSAFLMLLAVQQSYFVHSGKLNIF